MDLVAWRQAEQYAGTTLAGIASFITDNPGIVFFESVVVLSMLAAWGVYRRINKTTGETNDMRKRAILDAKYADMIGDGLFDMLHRDEIDRHEYKRTCRRFGIAYRLGDLLVANNKKRGMSSRIKNNIRTTKLLDASGNPIQPRIPGPKIAEVVPVPQKKQVDAKRWVAKGKSLLRVRAA